MTERNETRWDKMVRNEIEQEDGTKIYWTGDRTGENGRRLDKMDAERNWKGIRGRGWDWTERDCTVINGNKILIYISQW